MRSLIAAQKNLEIWATEELLKNKDNCNVPEEYRFNRTRSVGIQERPFKDILLFPSIGSMNKFKNRKKPFECFTPDGSGLPLFAFREVQCSQKNGFVSFIIFRYEIRKPGDFPSGNYKVKGLCNSFTLFKVQFCTVKTKRLLPEPVEEDYEFNFFSEPNGMTYRVFRKKFSNDIYVEYKNNILYKWECQTTDFGAFSNVLYIIKISVDNRSTLSDASNSWEAILSQEWYDCPVIGYYDRCFDMSFGIERKREPVQNFILGEAGPPDYDAFSIPWATQLNMCLFLVFHTIETRVRRGKNSKIKGIALS